MNFHTVDADRARGRFDQTIGHFQQSRLAATRRTQQNDQIAFGDRQGKLIDGGVVAIGVGLGDAVVVDRGRRCDELASRSLTRFHMPCLAMAGRLDVASRPDRNV